MVEALEVMSVEEALDHAEKVENGESSKELSRADSPISTRSHHAIERSFGGRMRRVFLFAVPICLVGAAVSIVMLNFHPSKNEKQTTSTDDFSQPKQTTSLLGKTKTETKKKEVGLYFNGMTALQSLLGDQMLAGRIVEVLVKDASWWENGAMLKPRDFVATPDAGSFRELQFVPMDEWFINLNQTREISSATIFDVVQGKDPVEVDVKLLQAQGVKRVRFSRQAMGFLLGSVFAEPAAAGTWTSVAASVFGAWLGPRSAADEGAGPRSAAGERVPQGAAADERALQRAARLASDLLEGRVMRGLAPVVMDEMLQKERSRSGFREAIQKDGAVLLSAYEAFVPLFRLVKKFSEAGITTILVADEFFNPCEIAWLFRKIIRPEDPAIDALGREISAGAADASVALRRSGPRFLVRCLLLLEKYGDDLSDSKTAAKLLEKEIIRHKNRLRSHASVDLLQLMQDSKLKVWRVGTNFAGTIPWFQASSAGETGFQLRGLFEHMLMSIAGQPRVLQEAAER